MDGVILGEDIIAVVEGEVKQSFHFLEQSIESVVGEKNWTFEKIESAWIEPRGCHARIKKEKMAMELLPLQGRVVSHRTFKSYKYSVATGAII